MRTTTGPSAGTGSPSETRALSAGLGARTGGAAASPSVAVESAGRTMRAGPVSRIIASHSPSLRLAVNRTIQEGPAGSAGTAASSRTATWSVSSPGSTAPGGGKVRCDGSPPASRERAGGSARSSRPTESAGCPTGSSPGPGGSEKAAARAGPGMSGGMSPVAAGSGFRLAVSASGPSTSKDSAGSTDAGTATGAGSAGTSSPSAARRSRCAASSSPTRTARSVQRRITSCSTAARSTASMSDHAARSSSTGQGPSRSWMASGDIDRTPTGRTWAMPGDATANARRRAALAARAQWRRIRVTALPPSPMLQCRGRALETRTAQR